MLASRFWRGPGNNDTFSRVLLSGRQVSAHVLCLLESWAGYVEGSVACEFSRFSKGVCVWIHRGQKRASLELELRELVNLLTWVLETRSLVLDL